MLLRLKSYVISFIYDVLFLTNGGYMRKCIKASLDAFINKYRQICSADDFANHFGHRNFHMPDGFLVSHGSLDLTAYFRNRSTPVSEDMTNLALPAAKYATLQKGNIKEKELANLRSVFSSGSILFQLLWHSIWDAASRKSEKIAIGRAANNDIVLPQNAISKAHGYLFIKDADVYFIDSSSNGTKHNGVNKKNNTFVINSEDTLGIGPYEFTYYPARDMFNKLVRIYKNTVNLPKRK